MKALRNGSIQLVRIWVGNTCHPNEALYRANIHLLTQQKFKVCCLQSYSIKNIQCVAIVKLKVKKTRMCIVNN